MRWKRTAFPLVLAIGLTVACSTAPRTQEARDELVEQASAALRDWDRDTPGLNGVARRSYGYACFPEIGKGGLVFGGSYGRGVVYEQGQHIGYADLSRGSLGLQVGGQAYQELIVFDDKAALERFKGGALDFSAEASGVFLETGSAVDVRFSRGVMVFMRPIGGAMGEASWGGQKFTFVPR